MNKLTLSASFLFLLVLPVLVSGACGPPSEEDSKIDKNQALKYKLVAIACILVAGAIGVFLPMIGKTIPALSPEKNVFFLIKAFAAGVILSTGFIHVLPDAFDNLTSACLPDNPWGAFPFTGFVAMMAAIVVLMVDAFAMSYFRKIHSKKAGSENGGDAEKVGDEHGGNHIHVHTHATHGHAHGSASLSESGSSDLLRHRVIAQVLELGIVVHSVIIGISLGASKSPDVVRPLVAALTFHQFFEGMGLGGCISQAKLKSRSVLVMALFFALTTPGGIAIGIGISSGYNEDSQKALIVEGIFNAASAGILIYMSLVDLLAADFMSPKMQSNFRLQVGANVSLLVGAGCMSLLAKWA